MHKKLQDEKEPAVLIELAQVTCNSKGTVRVLCPKHCLEVSTYKSLQVNCHVCSWTSMTLGAKPTKEVQHIKNKQLTNKEK